VRPEYERNSPRMSSNSYVNLKIATCLVRYADDRLIDQRFLRKVAGHAGLVVRHRIPAALRSSGENLRSDAEGSTSRRGARSS
jgi:hypothetical protein